MSSADPLLAWFAAQGWSPLPHQLEVHAAQDAGLSGLLIAPTGSGKTLALAGAWVRRHAGRASGLAVSARRKPASLKCLWITPMKALALDTHGHLQVLADALESGLRFELRSGDSLSAARQRARRGACDGLVTTPESLSLLLSYPEARESFANLELVVVDEWHELLGSKRGVLLELALARLVSMLPALLIWGASASIGNPQEALSVLCATRPQARLVRAAHRRQLILQTLLPDATRRFAYAGHLGIQQLRQVLAAIGNAGSSLCFTNVRSQAELWYQALAAVWPYAPEELALHHGSLSTAQRQAVEQGLRESRLRAVVCTSALDLGVDFPGVEQVIQIGSPRGLARLLQRAGRSQHRPHLASRVVMVPTHAFELIEFAAMRRSVDAGEVESRVPLELCLDVLIQHLASCAIGSGFNADEMWHEVRRSHAFRKLDATDYARCLDVIVRGGSALASYPDFQRVVCADGIYRMETRAQITRHRMSIGTITSESTIAIRLMRGGKLGEVEEGFIARLTPGTRFHFAGRALELVRIHDMVAHVRLAQGNSPTVVPRFSGGSLPISATLGAALRRELGQLQADSPERMAAAAMLATQAQRSRVPQPDELLIEYRVRADRNLAPGADQSRRAELYLYPFAGRRLHEGLGALIAVRLSRQQQLSLSYSANDYGLVLNSNTPQAFATLDAGRWRELLSPLTLDEDLRAVANLSELARRKFREIARVVGFTPPSLPGRAVRSMRQLQASSSMLYEVLREHDAQHVLLELALREALGAELDRAGLGECLERLQAQQLLQVEISELTPFSFPLWAEFQRGEVSSEDWRTRIERAAASMEAGHG